MDPAAYEIPRTVFSPVCSRPEPSTSATISGPWCSGSRCRSRASASIASSICTPSRSGGIQPSCKKSIRQVTAAYIASGLDPKRSIVFNQSQVPPHAELAWIFSCVARLGWLSRMTQFKEKAGKDRETASVGLYAYPNLMAADILAYRATHIPVGEDQKQHLELARDITQKFDSDFNGSIEAKGYTDGVFFPEPEPVITGPATRVMSLRDGTKKMSKSEPSDIRVST